MTDATARAPGPPGAGGRPALSAAQAVFAARAARRARIFLALSLAGVAFGVLLAAWTAWQRWLDPGYPVGLRAVVVVLVLLNARQNLRQYRYAKILAALRFGAPNGARTDARVT